MTAKKPIRMKADGTPDMRGRSPGSRSGLEKGQAKVAPGAYGDHEVPRIDYGDEIGTTPMLLAFRYVAKYPMKGRGEDSVMAAARRMKKKHPTAFLEKLDSLENAWAARRPTKPGTDLPLEIDRQSEKCLEAIDAFLKRCRAEAEEAGQKEREALRGARTG